MKHPTSNPQTPALVPHPPRPPQSLTTASPPAVVIFLLLLLGALLVLLYFYHHRYKGSYHTNEPKAVQDYSSAAKPLSARKDQNLPQILEEAKGD